MSQALLARRTFLAATLVIAGVLGVTVYLLTRNQTPHSIPRGPTDFREGALESGIDFRMAFLPNEQGEKFKINLYDHGCGVAIGDYDGDGREDIYFLNQLGPNGLFRNKGDGTFEDVTQKAGVQLGDRVCVGATFADTLNKGRQDLYVTSTRGGNVFFRNQGDGTFKDATKEAGLTCVAHSQTAVFFDFDNDGYLDLFVANTAHWTEDAYDQSAHYYPGPADFWELAKCKHESNILYRNNGDGTFTDVTARAGLAGKGWSSDAAVFDYNEDGYLDLVVTNMFGASQLYRNNGDGTFTDVTREILGRVSWGGIGAKVLDFKKGRLALLITDMHSDMWLSADSDPRSYPPGKLNKKYPHATGPLYDEFPGAREGEKRLADLFKIRYGEVLFGNSFFQIQPSGKFVEVSEKANLETFWPWGIATGDFDNDGCEDVFLPSGMGYPYYYWPNALMMNNGDGTFTDRAGRAGIEPPPGGEYSEINIGDKKAPRSSRCAAVADFNGDGRLSLVVNNFNDRAYFFRNHFPQKNYVAFRLTGTRSNRDAIGALVKLYSGKEVMVRQVQAAGGYLSQSSRTIHFGLGDRDKIDRVEIRWPSGKLQTIKNPPMNITHPVKEPS